MKIGKLLKTPMAKIGAIAAGGIVAATAVIFALSGQESFRTISVEEVNGTAVVVNEKGKDTAAYKGMHLYSGDDVSVQEASNLTLLLDMDKYVYAEENTHFRLVAEGDADCGKTVIVLEEGSVLNRIKEKLSEGETYEVNTPNSTMAVRGTVFRVTISRDADGMVYAQIEVLDGAVEISLKTVDGDPTGVTETFQSGEAALIQGNSDFSEFVADENGSIKHEISYEDLPAETAEILVDYIDDGEELCITRELLQDYTQLEEHKLQTVTVKQASCTETGEQQSVCEVCGEVIETTVLPKLAHRQGEWKTVLQETCTADGRRERACEVCGAVETEVIPAAGHSMGQWTVTREADCTTVGERVRTCGSCGETETETIAQTEHTMGQWEETEPQTCTEDGLRTRVCQVCGGAEEREVIPATGHSMGQWTVAREADCTAAGEWVRTCGSCGATETETIAKTAHTMGQWKEAKGATCTEDGLRTRVCSVCGGAEERKVIPTTGHSMGQWTVAREADCTAAGERVRTCGSCGATETETIAKTAHTMGPWKEAKGATCTEDGLRTRVCLVCGGAEEREVIPATGHTMGSWTVTKEADCATEGQRVRTCDSCGATETEAIAKTEHTMSQWEEAKSPTCTAEGLQLRSCLVCKAIEEAAIPATGHSTDMECIHTVTEELVPEMEFLCEYGGYCSVCGDYVVLEKNHKVLMGDDGFACEICGSVVMEIVWS